MPAPLGFFVLYWVGSIMDDLLLTFLAGIGLPVLTLVVHRYYREYPNEWEDVALSGGFGALSLVFGSWLLFEVPGAGVIVEFGSGVALGLALAYGFVAVWEAGDRAVRLVKKTRERGGFESP